MLLAKKNTHFFAFKIVIIYQIFLSELVLKKKRLLYNLTIRAHVHFMISTKREIRNLLEEKPQ